MFICRFTLQTTIWLDIHEHSPFSSSLPGGGGGGEKKRKWLIKRRRTTAQGNANVSLKCSLMTTGTIFVNRDEACTKESVTAFTFLRVRSILWSTMEDYALVLKILREKITDFYMLSTFIHNAASLSISWLVVTCLNKIGPWRKQPQQKREGGY